MNKRVMFAALALALLAAGAGAAETQPEPSKPLEAVVNGANLFAMDLYEQVAARQKGNLFLSPNSIHTALAMTYAGAAGRTAQQMALTLHFPPERDRLHPAFANLIKKLNSPRKDHKGKPAYELIVSNALWGQKDYPFKADFLKRIEASYGAGLNHVDFRKAEAARKTINDWVAQRTKDKIRDLIQQGAIRPLTRLILTNAIYFKSNWASKFQKRATRKEPFHLSGEKQIETPMMHQKDRFGYLETETLQVLELPYRFHDLSMVVLLPRKVDGLAALEKEMTAANVAKWLKGVSHQDVQVTFPKFRFTSQFNLARTLKAMGMTDAFSPERADFSGMTTMEKLAISDVVHKAFVAVDEEGTEAAAATAVMMAGTAFRPPAEPKVFKADHPFVFLIRHRATGAILFLGRVTNPGG
jgi:serpin B